jgi:hypothetical protein
VSVRFSLPSVNTIVFTCQYKRVRVIHSLLIHLFSLNYTYHAVIIIYVYVICFHVTHISFYLIFY